MGHELLRREWMVTAYPDKIRRDMFGEPEIVVVTRHHGKKLLDTLSCTSWQTWHFP